MLPSFRELTTFLPAEEAHIHRPRRTRFFFSGDLGSPKGASHAGPHVHPNYSMGIRQAVYRAVAQANSSDLQVTGHFQRDWWHQQYHAAMRCSLFCGSFLGDGWSGGISSAIFLGCVPVIVMDGVHLPFENVLNYSAFSVRARDGGTQTPPCPHTPRCPCTARPPLRIVAACCCVRRCHLPAARPAPPACQLRIGEADIPQLPRILRAVSPARVRELQANLHRVRARFGYASLAINELKINMRLTLNDPTDPTRGNLKRLAARSEEEEDALQTVLRLLLHKAAQRRAPRAKLGSGGVRSG